MTITVELNMKTPNMTNRREHHMARHRRAQAQHDATYMTLLGHGVRIALGPIKTSERLVVTLTRFSPGTLDAHDNLRAALKSVVDGVAKYFGHDDADPLFEWRYEQLKTKHHGVRIEFEVLP